MAASSYYSMMFCIIIFIFSTRFVFSQARLQCDQQQGSFLLQFKNEFSDTFFSTKLGSWKPDTDCCSWSGVTCTDGNVTGLDLGFERVSGSLNDTSPLFKLLHLTSINLALNYFEGTIPPAFGKLKYLEYLNLSQAGFEGQIPSNISQLKRLVSLDLSSLYFFGLKAEKPNLPTLLKDLPNLVELYLDNVDLQPLANDWSQILPSVLPNLRVLKLKHTGLSAPIQPSLAKLASLSVLDLSENNFNAPFPSFFAKFKNLSHLSLSDCGLSGKVSKNIFNLQALKLLDLSDNDLQIYFPTTLSHSPLETLVLARTKFAKSIPNSIGGLRKLSTLDLSECSLSGQIPSSFSKLSNLVYLDLSSNALSGPIPSFSRATNIQVLKLDGNELTGSILSTDWKIHTKITTLGLRLNSFTGSIPASLFTLPLLTQLRLDYNNFSSFEIGQPISTSSSQLTKLDLCFNKLRGPLPSSIFGLSGLEYIDLSINNFGVTLDLKSLEKMKNLYHLDLSHSNLAVEVGQSSLTFPKLEILRLASCNIKTIPAFLKNSPEISEVDLFDNNIHGIIPSWIWNVGKLTRLDLSHNYLLGAEATSTTAGIEIFDLRNNLFHGKLPRFPYARSLRLSANQLNSTILSIISEPMSSLIGLELSSNNLRGSIPENICTYTSLYLLDISDNILSGSIPECISKATDVYSLNMSHNSLTGPIPESIANLTGLQSLDLSSNRLSGKIPEQLANLFSLSFLNVSYNQLVGKIPNFTQFENFPAASFEGNKGLCGFPLTTKCKD